MKFTHFLVDYFYFILDFNPHYSIVGFQSPATPIMEGIIDLHNYIFFYLILVFVVVSWMFCYILSSFYFVPTFCQDIFIHQKIMKQFGLKEPFFIRRILRPFIRFLLMFNKDLAKERMLLKYFQYSFGSSAKERQVDYRITRKVVEHAFIEFSWTVLPSIILVLIAVPSFALLYAMDEIIDPKLTVKAIGYQWFWSYEYAETKDEIIYNEDTDLRGYNYREYRNYLNYDSIMYAEEDLPYGYHRLLDVDHQMILPTKVHIRLMITGADVIHSWAVPSLGVKVDAIPGRMNQIGVFIKRQGVFYGQCSELCGVNHGFMPIAVKAVSYTNFLKWYYTREISFNS